IRTEKSGKRSRRSRRRDRTTSCQWLSVIGCRLSRDNGQPTTDNHCYSPAMPKRVALLLLLALAALPATAARHGAKAAPAEVQAVTVDTHADTPSEFLKE